MSRRVVVTGMGTMSPVGNHVAEAWANLLAGKSVAGPITLCDTTGLGTRFAAEVKGFDPTDYMEPKEARRMDRFNHLALAAIKQALADAKLVITPELAPEVGVIFGSGIGGLNTILEQSKVLEERGPGRISPFATTMLIIDMAAGYASISLGAKGPNWGIVSACATSGHAIGEACEIIRRGDALAMIAGGSEAPINRLGLAAFNAARAISTRNEAPERASRPFDAQRDGFVVAEGAAALVLEDLEFALRRGAQIFAEVVGYAATADAYHITAPPPDGNGAVRSMRRALEKAGLRPDHVDYINAHGTSTVLNDKSETVAIKTVFGEVAWRVPISSTKSMTGHLIGAAGAFEAIVCIKAIQDGIVPPTINYEYPDPDCDLDYVPNVARRTTVNVAMSNSFGFGGHNSTLIFRRYP
ncbi:MAG: beta-ketoacyl-ACP synthase II [Chloroflexi bacterium]|nr:beta-ketoacyl-ACP synthase II [Chloroflexota bacterium]